MSAICVIEKQQLLAYEQEVAYQPKKISMLVTYLI